MANILYAWELGGGLGHLARVVPLLNRLEGAGHTVYSAVRDLPSATRFRDQANCRWLQAPVQLRSSKLFEPPHTFAHILANMCFGDRLSLDSRVMGWRSLIDLVEPELLIVDHAPTAALASRGGSCRRLTIGTGFCCPRPLATFPNWRPERPLNGRSLENEEAEVLTAVNQWLAADGQTPLGRLSDLFAELDDTALTTYPELDHFGPRPNTPYSGVWTSSPGKRFQWPTAGGPKVFGYLKKFPGLPATLEVLKQSPTRCVVFAPGITPEEQKRLSSPSLTISREPLDVSQAATECDIAVSHGGHGTAASILSAGKPMIVLPLQLEQRLNGENVSRMGAGVLVNPNDPRALVDALKAIITKVSFRKSAMTFAQRHKQFDPEKSLENVALRCLRLIDQASK